MSAGFQQYQALMVDNKIACQGERLVQLSETIRDNVTLKQVIDSRIVLAIDQVIGAIRHE
jgi:hypothetical protein